MPRNNTRFAKKPARKTPARKERQLKRYFTTGTNPMSVAIDDFNGDGKPDLAFTNQGSLSVSVLLNTTAPGAATPSFLSRVDFTTGTAPISVAVDDLNGDGKPDLAVANVAPGTVSVLLNTTAPGPATAFPTFRSRVDFETGTSPVSVAIDDLNGDGTPDLAIANIGSNTVSVLLNSAAPGAATPTFQGRVDFTTATAPHGVATGDLNGDSKPDLALANFSSNSVSILLSE